MYPLFYTPIIFILLPFLILCLIVWLTNNEENANKHVRCGYKPNTIDTMKNLRKNRFETLDGRKYARPKFQTALIVNARGPSVHIRAVQKRPIRYYSLPTP